MKSIVTSIITLFIPINFIKIFFLKILGHKVTYSSKIGLSFIKINQLILSKNTKIGHLNFIKINSVTLKEHAFIKHLNIIKGPFNLIIKDKGSMSNQNKIRRSYAPVTYGKSNLVIGKNTQIVSNQFLDLTRSIIFGENSQIAGIGAQFWTHGYVHFKEHKRIRVDGEIIIGDNVYIGSRCIFNAGVKVSDNITIGSNSTVSKNLEQEGLYVNQALRFINKDMKFDFNRYTKIESNQDMIDTVYEKK
jgi:acetyltransferase-like isoleucine patch superfamily enzyme